MKALVTGGTGFLGRRVVSRLLGREMEVCCLVRPSSNIAPLYDSIDPRFHARLQIIRCHLESVGSSLVEVAGVEVCFHLASELRGATSVLFRSNVHGTRKLMDFASRLQVRRVVHVSSLGVYDAGHLRPGELLDESCPLDPEPHRRDGYTYSKIAQERVVWEASQQQSLPLVVVRPGVVFGPGRDCISSRIGLRLGNFLLHIGGARPLPYTYVENCADAIVQAGLEPAAEGQAFNLVDDNLPASCDLLKTYRRQVKGLHKLTVPQRAIGPLSALCEWYHRWSNGQLPAVLTRYKSAAMWKPVRYSNAKAKAMLGWSPAVDFPTALNATLAWLREHRQDVPAA
jgi:nucleoside-diphosphate-sugar epimerase